MSNESTTQTPNDARTYDEICQSICMLTCVLNDVQIGSPEDRRARRTSSSRSSASHSSSPLKAMQHITTLLTTRTPTVPETLDNAKKMSNYYANRVIAVTGRVRPEDNSIDILAARNTQKQFSPNSMELKELKAKEDGAHILRVWNERSFEDHFADTFTILDWFRVNKSGFKKRFELALYIVNHAHFKIAGRMIKGERLWKIHPIHALRLRIQSISIPNALLPFEIKNISRFTMALIKERGFTPSKTDNPVFVVDQDNLASWLSLICDVYEELDNILIDSPKRVPNGRIGGHDVYTVAFNLYILHGLLNSGLVDLVLEDEIFLADLETSYDDAAKDRHKKIAIKIPGSSAALDPPVDVEDEMEVVTESSCMPGEEHSKYVVRYLKTVVAWIEAFQWANTSRNLSVTLHAYEVLLPLHPFRIQHQTQIAQFKQRLGSLVHGVSTAQLDLLFGRDRAKLNATNIHNATVHAEAGLMAVACAAWNTEGDQDPASLQIEDEDAKRVLRDMFSVQEVPIGVSRLCCWCCWKLRALLGELNGEDAAACPQFLLSGTHATVFPWYPPLCGIPRSVLKSMEDELILEVEKLARRHTFDNASHQSSPSSADSDRVDEGQGMRLPGMREARDRYPEPEGDEDYLN